MPSLMNIAKKQKNKPKAAKTGSSRKPATGNRKPVTRTSFPVEQVTKLWNEGKSIEEIAKAINRYRKDAPDPTSGFRGSLNQLRAKGVLKIGFARDRKRKAA